MKMKKLKYQVRFLTPAFLGNAEQSGQWRTPPFKALLRQWWRVAYAASGGFNVDVLKMRQEEGLLFGNAWLENNFCKSRVLIRIDRWDEGKLRSWQPGETVLHPEVRFPIGADLYLGYGPIILPRGSRQPQLKAKTAIQPGETAHLRLAVRTSDQKLIERTLWLINRYATVGGRSRNGWGSFLVTPVAETPKPNADVNEFTRFWKEALKENWPHALGKDERGVLVWETPGFDDWRPVIRSLAIVRIAVRTQFVFPDTKPPHRDIEPRHWLSYPITRHNTTRWKQSFRLPNSLRFKVRQEEDGKFSGVIFHIPCSPPREFQPDRVALIETWEAVHDLLDELTVSPQSRGYKMVRDQRRRQQLKPGLDEVLLNRISE